jgi:ATP-dependent Clp protease ATP-binding subunit ClpA
LGDNRRVDLSQTVIFMTSNLGGSEITELMHGGMGFIQPEDKPMTGLDVKVERTALAKLEAVRRKFSPEFMNRLDKTVVFHPLKREQLAEVLLIELGQLQQRVLETQNGPRISVMRGHGSALRRSPSEASYRAPRSFPFGEPVGHGTGEVRRHALH